MGRRRKWGRNKCTITVLIFVGTIYFWISFQFETTWKYLANLNIESPNKYSSSDSDPNSSTKLILFWSTRFRDDSLEGWGVDKEFTSCPKKCLFTNDKSLFTSSHAIVYHGFPEAYNYLIGKEYLYPLPTPKHRNPNQVWIYFTMEPPPPHWELYETLNDNYDFNWTMTYRTDSDIWRPYGLFKEREKYPTTFETSPKYLHHSSEGKRFAVALISECSRPSGRDEYIRELQKTIPVDIYGSCGNLTCDKNANCYNLLAPKYKFWLSFENSLCYDYITEKLFNALESQSGIVPVYFGHNSIKEIKSIPQDAYINTNDFESPRALGEYLIHLDENPDEYYKYFELHKKYELVQNLSDKVWCEVCKKLYEIDANNHKSYKSVREWLLRNNTKYPVCGIAYGKRD